MKPATRRAAVPPATLRLIALTEAAKGVLVLAAGAGLLELVHADLGAAAAALLAHFHLNPAHGYPRVFADAVAHVSRADLWLLAAGATVYAGLRLAEGYGLWFERRWAEWLGVLSSGIYVPIELYELTRGFEWVKLAPLAVNLVVLAYLGWRLAQRCGAEKSG